MLGAGGFTPHAATDVLALHYGDCKDHVMLLEALLAARGIVSNPALIAAGGAYVLPDGPSPFYFNHLITYVPEFRLFLDSTAHYAPFGVLPLPDADRPTSCSLPGGVEVIHAEQFGRPGNGACHGDCQVRRGRHCERRVANPAYRQRR